MFGLLLIKKVQRNVLNVGTDIIFNADNYVRFRVIPGTLVEKLILNVKIDRKIQ